LFLRQFAFGLGLFKRFKRQFQLWCCDLFHVSSVSRSGKTVTRQAKESCHA
jgi:hypothetical protein